MALGARGADGLYAVRVLTPAGQVETRQVAIGLNDKTFAEVRSGLGEGERVVTGDTANLPVAASAQMPGPPPGGGL
jgi:macrolide-specific efflux system membrane fusion protein